MSRKVRFALSVIAVLAVAAAAVLGEFFLSGGRYYLTVTVCLILSLLPFFFAFERSERSAREIAVLAVCVALSVGGRAAFFFLPGFKPVASIAILSGIAFGGEAGFFVGALSACLSGIFYGLGPWTPFQMFAWGLPGLVGGWFFHRKMHPHPVLLAVFGIVSAAAFSAITDVWTALAFYGSLAPNVYLACITASLPFTVEYAVSNVLFLFLLVRPFLDGAKRLKNKFGVF